MPAAARVAKNMLDSFSYICIGFMVGIDNGVSSQKHDICPGDVVLSTAGDCNGGVFQYDFGKMTQDKNFHSTKFLN